MCSKFHIILLLFVIGCGEQKIGFPSKESLIQQHIKNCNSKDFKAYLETFHPKCIKGIKKTFPNNSYQNLWLKQNSRPIPSNAKIEYSDKPFSSYPSAYTYEIKPNHFVYISYEVENSNVNKYIKLLNIDNQWYQVAPNLPKKHVENIKQSFKK
jgi:hypothetical protein